MLVFGEINFDSDQAIVGLMAKHLSELQTFPLYFYGQGYMLGVEAWIAAPFFLVGRTDGRDAQAAAGARQLRRGRVAGAVDRRRRCGRPGWR